MIFLKTIILIYPIITCLMLFCAPQHTIVPPFEDNRPVIDSDSGIVIIEPGLNVREDAQCQP